MCKLPRRNSYQTSFSFWKKTKQNISFLLYRPFFPFKTLFRKEICCCFQTGPPVVLSSGHALCALMPHEQIHPDVDFFDASQGVCLNVCLCCTEIWFMAGQMQGLERKDRWVLCLCVSVCAGGRTAGGGAGPNMLMFRRRKERGLFTRPSW